MPGVTIGDGAVVGACSLVTRNVQPWTVVAGSPARFLRFKEPSFIEAVEKT
jgi:acetyltransferase-like isoleucine patch superfamily enzyme